MSFISYIIRNRLPMKSVYDYLNFRDFLREHLASRRKENPHLSLRSIAYRIGCDPGLFSKVLNGTRSLSAESVLKLVEVLRLGKKERYYSGTGSRGYARRRIIPERKKDCTRSSKEMRNTSIPHQKNDVCSGTAFSLILAPLRGHSPRRVALIKGFSLW